MDKQKLAVLARKNSSKWKGIDRESKREREGERECARAGRQTEAAATDGK